MTATESALRFEQMHIDVARNASDDFNPFHDPRHWQEVRDNPFGGPIVLGFQLEFLTADRIARQRSGNGEAALVEAHKLHFSNYEFRFTSALRVGEPFRLEVRDTQDRTADGGGLSNRLLVKKYSGHPILIGTQSETPAPRFLADANLSRLPSLQHMPDRTTPPGTRYFLKRKFLNTSNGKNFTLGALCDQHDYFDEMTEQVYFPPLYTASLMSSALLEKGRAEGYDFAADPLVYSRHQISIDKRLQARLRSNDVLHILVEGPFEEDGQGPVERHHYHCFGLLHGEHLLFRTSVHLAPLHEFLHRDEGRPLTTGRRPAASGPPQIAAY